MTIANPFAGDVVEMELAHMNKDRVEAASKAAIFECRRLPDGRLGF